MKKRLERQEVVRRVVRRERIRTQRDLVDRLHAQGFVCTQATVSRDITEMGLKKLPEGVYVLAEDLHLQRMISELVTKVVQADTMVIVKASPGTAPGVAAALDGAGLDEVLGSIAGDDTILVITKSAQDATAIVSTIDKYRGRS
ncbi:MAG TPA: ArgR family transcriptional regulator [Coriobacteriia bacterium]